MLTRRKCRFLKCLFVMIFVLTSHLRYCEIFANLRFKLYWIRGNQDLFQDIDYTSDHEPAGGRGRGDDGDQVAAQHPHAALLHLPHHQQQHIQPGLSIEERFQYNIIWTSTMNPHPLHLSPYTLNVLKNIRTSISVSTFPSPMDILLPSAWILS